MLPNIFLIFLLFSTFSIFAQTDSKHTVNINNQTRSYLVHQPPQTGPYPVVVNCHGQGSTAEEQREWSQFNPIADTAGFMVVYPEALAPDRLWSPEDDFPFLNQLLDQLSTDFDIDTSRIYACGFSGGGFIAHYLGSVLSEKIAAIGSVAGLLPDWLSLKQPEFSVPVIMIHDSLDQFVPFDGVPETIQQWLSWNGCSDTPELQSISNDPALTLSTYANCDSQAIVQLYSFSNPIFDGHFWPWEECCAINASERLWSFFRNYQRKVSGTGNPTSISLLNQDLGISVTPNPSKGELFLQNTPQQLEIFLYDLELKEAFSGQYHTHSGKLRLELPSLAPGTYLLRMIDEANGILQWERIQMNRGSY